MDRECNGLGSEPTDTEFIGNLFAAYSRYADNPVISESQKKEVKRTFPSNLEKLEPLFYFVE